MLQSICSIRHRQQSSCQTRSVRESCRWSNSSPWRAEPCRFLSGAPWNPVGSGNLCRRSHHLEEPHCGIVGCNWTLKQHERTNIKKSAATNHVRLVRETHRSHLQPWNSCRLASLPRWNSSRKSHPQCTQLLWRDGRPPGGGKGSGTPWLRLHCLFPDTSSSSKSKDITKRTDRQEGEALDVLAMYTMNGSSSTSYFYNHPKRNGPVKYSKKH